MIKVVGIRFQRAGKIYYFDPLDYDLETAMHVIVETARGVEMGTVLIPPKEVDDDKVVQPLKPVIRIATDDDEKVIEKNKEIRDIVIKECKNKDAIKIIQEMITGDVTLGDRKTALFTQMLHSELDADGIDYLMRDSYFSGASFGHFELDLLINSMCVAEYNGFDILCIDEKGIAAADQYLINKFFFIYNISFKTHKNKII